MGAAVLGALVGVATTDGGLLLAPPLEVAALGLGLLLAGAYVGVSQNTPVALRTTLAGLSIILMLVVCNWSGFVPDVSYKLTASVGPSAWQWNDIVGGRIVFGAAAVVLDLIVVAGLLSWTVGRFQRRR
ncbi:MAG TPA: hypothetical protein VGA52_01255 [Anaerolineales bacterium]|jgi:hypothetical protein